LFDLTPKGKQIFKGFENTQHPGYAPPLKAVVTEVTDIADTGQTQKTVTFNWNIDASKLPPEIRPLVKDHPPKPAEAYFTLYDDGWRFDALSK
jgi:hypothetical protein